MGPNKLNHILFAVCFAVGAISASSAALAQGTVPNAALEALQQRIDELDRDVKDLTGTVEEMGYRIQQLENALIAGSPSGDPMPSDAGGGAAPVPISGNNAGGTGLAPPETVLGQIPADTELPSEPDFASYQDQYQAALGYLRQQDYARAELALKRFVTEHSETELAGPATYWLGETYFAQDSFAQAAEAYFDSLKKYPDSPKAPDAMLKLGMSLLSLGEKGQACAAFKELPGQYPNASETIKQRAKVESDRASCPK